MPFVPITDAKSFKRAISLGQTVEDFLEFKSGYGWHRDAPDHVGQMEELCRDVAEFANSEGGVLLVGVGEKERSGRLVANSIVGVMRRDDDEREVQGAVVRQPLEERGIPVRRVALQLQDKVPRHVPVRPSLVDLEGAPERLLEVGVGSVRGRTHLASGDGAPFCVGDDNISADIDAASALGGERARHRLDPVRPDRV